MKLKQFYDYHEMSLVMLITNFPQKLFLTNAQIAHLRKAFANKSSTILSCQKLNYLK